MTNVCKSCGETVTPGPDGSSCPNCGSIKGFTVSSTWTFRHNIENGISRYNEQIERLKKIQEHYKETKVEEKLEEEIKKLKKIIDDLNNLLIKQEKEVIVKDEVKFTDEVIVEKNTHTKTFTTGAILVKEAESKIKEGDKVVDVSNRDIWDLVEDLRLKIEKAERKNTRFAVIGIIVGAILGFLGSYIVAIITAPKIPTVIFTNGTVIFP